MVPAVQRTRRRQRPRSLHDAGDPHRRRVAGERVEGVDQHGHYADLGFALVRTDPDAPKHPASPAWPSTCTRRGWTCARCGRSPAARRSTRSSWTTCSCPTRTSSARSTGLGGGAHDAGQRARVARCGAGRGDPHARRCRRAGGSQRRHRDRCAAGRGPHASRHQPSPGDARHHRRRTGCRGQRDEAGQRRALTTRRRPRPAAQRSVRRLQRGRPAHVGTRMLTIAGGTSEIVRNTIAERILGLPRDPRPGE